MKTRDRILAGALALFNEEGAAPLSAVDVASSLGISPGHLYYHFRGKPEIVVALFDAFDAELSLVLEGAVADMARPEAGLKDLAVHVTILVEEVHDMRFLWREAGALAAAMPALRPRYRRALAALRGAFDAMLGALVPDQGLRADAARAMAAGVAFRLSQIDLETDPEPPRQRIARAAADIVHVVRLSASRA